MKTLADFFKQTNADVAIFTLGRRVQRLSLETFESFEREQTPWPLPWKDQAQFACAILWPGMDDPAIWFLALPLDEQAMLSPASRDAFLERLLRTASPVAEGTTSAADESQPTVENLMQDNPLAFDPEIHQRALLHALLARYFGRPASPHAELARRYFAQTETVNWQMIGLQGLADLVIDRETLDDVIWQQRLPELPREVLLPLCYCLEQGHASDALVKTLISQLDAAWADADLERYCALLRAIVGSESSLASAWLEQWLTAPPSQAADCLVAVAARGWHHLEHEIRLERFLDRLATCEKLNFRRVIHDLALIPRLRLPIVMMLRQAPTDSAVGRRVTEWKL
ncbi:DUF3549 family protein [Salinicola aestuarinus]|uniref:DUF3549 family protein n=1 Tax=Salinicola aestuarinus TaxID=1949082 RepID=UPI000DA14036|nr:DUF3549 family protein [Salinicola aestuarinus]